MKVCMSAGHSSIVRGAEGPSPWGLDEFDENVRVVNQTAIELRSRGVEVATYIDMVSNDQDENLNRIVDWHNAQGNHDLDISVHFNSATFNGSNQTSNPVGTEVFYESNAGKEWAKKIVDAIAGASGLKNRGPKDGNLYFLSNTAEVAVLLEICFVNSKADAEIYRDKFAEICAAIAARIAGEEIAPGPEPEPEPEPEPPGVLFSASGTCSWFGGPEDSGVSPSEGLAFIFDVMEKPELFLPYQPSGTSGLARRLNPFVHFIACRWDYSVTPKTMLRDSGKMALVTAIKTGISMLAIPADWGPHEEQTGRAADLSQSLMQDLGIGTDDLVEVVYPYEP